MEILHMIVVVAIDIVVIIVVMIHGCGHHVRWRHRMRMMHMGGFVEITVRRQIEGGQFVIQSWRWWQQMMMILMNDCLRKWNRLWMMNLWSMMESGML